VTGIAALAFADEERMLARWADPHAAYFDRVLHEKMALELAYRQRRTWLTDLAIVVASPLAPWAPWLRRWLVARLVAASPVAAQEART
jgi:hypothetical protein